MLAVKLHYYSLLSILKCWHVAQKSQGSDVKVVLKTSSPYPCKLWGIQGRMQECFNVRHGRAQSIIERTFGVMKARWRSTLFKALEVKPAFCFVQRSSWPVQSSTMCAWTIGMSWRSQRSSLRILPPLLQFNSSRREVEPTSGTGYVPRFLHPNNLGPRRAQAGISSVEAFFYISYSKYKFGVEWNALLCFAILSNLVLCLTFSVQW